MTAYAAVIEASDLAEKKVAILRRALMLNIGATPKGPAKASPPATKKRLKLAGKKKR